MQNSAPPSRRALRLLALLLPLLGLPTPGGVLASDTVPRSARAISDGDSLRVQATLEAVWLDAGRGKLGVRFDLDPGWHLYWRNPGDTGLAPHFDWEVPGAVLGEVEWPLPRRFEDPDLGMVSYGYEDSVLLALPLEWDGTPPERVGVALRFLACADQCIPGELSLSAAFPPSLDPEAYALFAAWEELLPLPAAESGVAVRLRAPGTLTPEAELALDLAVAPCPPGGPCDLQPGRHQGLFYPYRDPAFADVTSALGESSEDGAFGLDLVARVADATAGDGTLRGVLVLDERGASRGFEIEIPWRQNDAGDAEVATVAPAAAGPGNGSLSGARTTLWRAALLGFLGGLILNLMPCVLPVLALKIFALTDLASRSRREVALHVGAYTGGILLAMSVLAGFVVGLRAAGTAVGWGFHLQEPLFVVGVCCVLVAFALNLFGVFEINVDTSRLAGIGAERSGAGRSFFDGLLAVVLATPCSAPFLGTAVGFAFASSGWVIGVIFASIGLGLAAPFGLAAAVPAFGRRIPRSGPWMLHLRAGLGFTLLATAVGLLWVLGRSAGPDAMAGTLIVLVVVSLVTWAFGILQRLGRPLPMAALLVALAAVGYAGAGLLDLSPAEGSALARADAKTEGVEDWDPDRIEAVLAAGRPAFVYFTADWCLTCKVNEATVLGAPEVTETFRSLGIPIFRGDWTRRDDALRRALARLGKAGVPAYALYQPHAPDNPLVLPELLSVERLVSELQAASVLASGGIRRASLPSAAPAPDTRS